LEDCARHAVRALDLPIDPGQKYPLLTVVDCPNGTLMA
jgi:hypothetical protein